SDSRASTVEPAKVVVEQVAVPEAKHTKPDAVPPPAPDAGAGQNQDLFGKRRFAALAAVVALATFAGALGGAFATTGLSHFRGTDAANAGPYALEQAVARIDAKIATLSVTSAMALR